MKDPVNPSLMVNPAENLEDAPFDAKELINEVVNPPDPPLQLSPPVDPSSLIATIGIEEGLPPIAAVEVGGVGTGTWAWLSTLPAGVSIGALALLAVVVGAIATSVWRGISTPQNTPATQTDAQGHTVANPRLDIVNNPLPDNPRPFLDAPKASSPLTASADPNAIQQPPLSNAPSAIASDPRYEVKPSQGTMRGIPFAASPSGLEGTWEARAGGENCESGVATWRFVKTAPGSYAFVEGTQRLIFNEVAPNRFYNKSHQAEFDPLSSGGVHDNSTDSQTTLDLNPDGQTLSFSMSYLCPGCIGGGAWTQGCSGRARKLH
jgi:hypothetical protein